MRLAPGELEHTSVRHQLHIRRSQMFFFTRPTVSRPQECGLAPHQRCLKLCISLRVHKVRTQWTLKIAQSVNTMHIELTQSVNTVNIEHCTWNNAMPQRVVINVMLHRTRCLTHVRHIVGNRILVWLESWPKWVGYWGRCHVLQWSLQPKCNSYKNTTCTQCQF